MPNQISWEPWWVWLNCSSVTWSECLESTWFIVKQRQTIKRNRPNVYMTPTTRGMTPTMTTPPHTGEAAGKGRIVGCTLSRQHESNKAVAVSRQPASAVCQSKIKPPQRSEQYTLSRESRKTDGYYCRPHALFWVSLHNVGRRKRKKETHLSSADAASTSNGFLPLESVRSRSNQVKSCARKQKCTNVGIVLFRLLWSGPSHLLIIIEVGVCSPAPHNHST